MDKIARRGLPILNYKLLKTRKLLLQHVSEVMSLFSKVDNLPLPRGVKGRRIVRGFRSEMDRKHKDMLDEMLEAREKDEKYKQKQWREISMKRITYAYDSKIEQWKQWVENKGHLTKEDHASFKKELKLLVAQRDWELRNTEHKLKRQSERYMKLRMEAHRGDIMARMGTFVYRFKYVMDTYGGQIFRGTAICSEKTQKGWKKYKEFVAPK